MVESSGCQQIVICGHRGEAGGVLATLLAASADSPVEVRSGVSALKVELVAGRTVVTYSPEDVWGVKRIVTEATRVILLMRDPRDLLLLRRADANDEFDIGYDHGLDVSPAGIVTLSDPGVVHTQMIIESIAQRFPQALILRHEDLLRNPNLVQVALERFTGLQLSKRFSELLSANATWQAGTKRRFCYEAANGTLMPEAAERLARQFMLAPDLFHILDHWGYEEVGDRRWFHDLVRDTPQASDNLPGTIVGYYTQGTLYEAEAARMAASIRRLNLPFELTPIESSNDWLKTVRLKPNFLLEARRRLRGPLLYVDVDAVIHRDPWPYLRGYGGDVAVSGHRGEAIISGTILLNDTAGAVEFIQAWIAEQDRRPDAWDQHTLEAAVLALRHDSNAKMRIQYLPPEMCRVFNRAYSFPVEAVIEHLQASRERFADSDDAGLQQNLTRRRARVAELEMSLRQVMAPADSSTSQPSFADQPPEARRQLSQHLIASGQSDLQRWSDPVNFKPSWSDRARLVAALIQPTERVLDLGCGAMDLEKHLPPSTHYLPADLCRRDDRTLLVDLNAGSVPHVEADVVTLLGVLEYVHDPARLLARLSQQWRRLIVTYHPIDLHPGQDRRSHGWFNDLSSAELVAMAVSAGYQLESIVPYGERERLYTFSIVKSAT